MGLSKGLDGHSTILGDGGGHRGDQIGGHGGFGRLDSSLVVRVFPHLYTLQNFVYLRFLERLVPVNIIHQFLNLFKAFSALGKVHNEIMDASHHYSW
jgi:hypothetical protein